MSNLSDIGFPVRSEHDVNDVIMSILKHLETIVCPPRGFYFKFKDKSGAEIYLQTNSAQEIIGFNPSFSGKSKRRVGLTEIIERDTSDLDGAFHAWANPKEEDFENSGEYPLVFDVPDFRVYENIELPKLAEIQLNAFASNDFQIFANAEDFDSSQTEETKFASNFFIPGGLFSVNENEETDDIIPPQAHAMFAGEIKEFELKTNEFTGEAFYWFWVETFGGQIDVVADIALVKEKPQIKGIVRGSFWLSGKLIGENITEK
jgi:hypothetical protein